MFDQSSLHFIVCRCRGERSVNVKRSPVPFVWGRCWGHTRWLSPAEMASVSTSQVEKKDLGHKCFECKETFKSPGDTETTRHILGSSEGGVQSRFSLAFSGGGVFGMGKRVFLSTHFFLEALFYT